MSDIRIVLHAKREQIRKNYHSVAVDEAGVLHRCVEAKGAFVVDVACSVTGSLTLSRHGASFCPVCKPVPA